MSDIRIPLKEETVVAVYCAAMAEFNQPDDVYLTAEVRNAAIQDSAAYHLLRVAELVSLWEAAQ